jgi:hypothetical protein
MRNVIAAVATRKWNRNGHISKRSKKIHAYGKEKDILISTVRVMRHLFYIEDNMTLQKIILSIKPRTKRSRRRESEEKEKRKQKQNRRKEKTVSFIQTHS